jgi:hypothetical protein
MKNNTIIQFSGNVSERKESDEPVWRISGLVPLKYIVKLINQVSLKANPREAKHNSTVDDIVDSISNDPSLFHYKNKGILISSESLKVLEKKGNKCRCSVDFINEDYEGILDGGHTTFSIGKYVLGEVLGNDHRDYKSIKTWARLKEIWSEHLDLIDELINRTEKDEEYIPSFLIPVEILYRNNSEKVQDDEKNQERYFNAIYEIACARNNNTQLTVQARDNKLGYYSIIQDNISADLNDKISWRNGETDEQGSKKPISSADIISLSLVSLSKCDTVENIPPTLIYNGKTSAAKLFVKITQNDQNDHNLMKSAMSLIDDLVNSYEELYLRFPSAYNSVRPGFGGINCVKKDKYKDRKGKERTRDLVTKFKGTATRYSYPHAYIAPLFWSLSVLLEKKSAGRNGVKLTWKVSPTKFIEHLLQDTDFMGYYTEAIKEVNFDPNKFAKRSTIYDNLLTRCELIKLKHF